MASTAHRWHFFDPVTVEDLVIFLNPKELRLPDQEKDITATSTTAPGGEGRTILTEGGAPKPATIGFVGVTLTLEHIAFLQNLYDRPRQLRLTDDFAREWWIYIYKFTQTRPKTRPSHPEYHTYTMDAYILDWPTT